MPRNTSKQYADQVIDLVNSKLLTSPAHEHEYEVEKRRHQFAFSFADLDQSKLEGFFTALNPFDVKNALLTCRHGQVGETEYYAMIRGKLQHFDSLEDDQEAISKGRRPAKQQRALQR